jgi:cell division protein FtsB
MLDIQQKRKLRSVMYHRATLGVLSVVVLFFLHSTWSVYQKKRESEKARNLSEQSVTALRQRDSDLKAKIDRLDTTPGIEEEIRLKYSVAKENERVVIIVENQTSTTTEDVEDVGFWQSFKDFLTGKW